MPGERRQEAGADVAVLLARWAIDSTQGVRRAGGTRADSPCRHRRMIPGTACGRLPVSIRKIINLFLTASLPICRCSAGRENGRSSVATRARLSSSRSLQRLLIGDLGLPAGWKWNLRRCWAPAGRHRSAQPVEIDLDLDDVLRRREGDQRVEDVLHRAGVDAAGYCSRRQPPG